MAEYKTQVIERKLGKPTLFDIPISLPSSPTKVLVKTPVAKEKIINHKADIEKTLNAIFPSKKDETKLQKARRILGEEVSKVTDDELGVYLAEFHFLLESWLDEYEREVFDNKTLKELTKEGQNGTTLSR